MKDDVGGEQNDVGPLFSHGNFINSMSDFSPLPFTIRGSKINKTLRTFQ